MKCKFRNYYYHYFIIIIIVIIISIIIIVISLLLCWTSEVWATGNLHLFVSGRCCKLVSLVRCYCEQNAQFQDRISEFFGVSRVKTLRDIVFITTSQQLSNGCKEMRIRLEMYAVLSHCAKCTFQGQAHLCIQTYLLTCIYIYIPIYTYIRACI